MAQPRFQFPSLHGNMSKEELYRNMQALERWINAQVVNQIVAGSGVTITEHTQQLGTGGKGTGIVTINAAGGQTLTPQSIPQPITAGTIYDIAALSDTEWFLLGGGMGVSSAGISNASLLHTTNAGTSWASLASPAAGGNTTSLWMDASGNGIMLGASQGSAQYSYTTNKWTTYTQSASLQAQGSTNGVCYCTSSGLWVIQMGASATPSVNGEYHAAAVAGPWTNIPGTIIGGGSLPGRMMIAVLGSTIVIPMDGQAGNAMKAMLSSNGGSAFTATATGAGNFQVNTGVAAVGSNGYLWMGGLTNAQSPSLYYTTDNGATWNTFSTDPFGGAGVGALMHNKDGSKILIGLAHNGNWAPTYPSGGLYYMDDAGTTLNRIGDPFHVAAGGVCKVARATPGGAYWLFGGGVAANYSDSPLQVYQAQ